MYHIRIDHTGKRFSRLLVLEYSHTKNRRAYWKCICDCGQIRIVWAGHLPNGHTKSCGCFRIQRTKESNTGSAHSSWKGDNASYAVIHAGLRRKNTIRKCENCSSNKYIQIALIHGRTYSRNLSDYKILCRICHIKYDKREKLKKFHATKKKRNNP